MQLTTHPLIEEFPEYKDQVHTLKMNNAHFRRLTHEYEGIDKSIVRAEQGLETVNDDYLSEIKKERLHLKDLIYQMIKNQ
ncbi:MAG: YdcH family protein [Gammaproteobacteria bacterium]|nr:YdcH family protein [Gammaproteobacteria bacterium]